MRAVTVVPMFAPKVNGKIWRRLNTPATASGTTRDVVIDQLCTMIVIKTPKPTALNAVLNMY